MASKSTLDPDNPAGPYATAKARGTPSLGPSDSSDSGSDLAGIGGEHDGESACADSAAARTDGSDRYGTGERRSAGKDENPPAGRDIDVDREVGADEAGLGGGLDQAEEAQLGVTDEQLARRGHDRAPGGKQRR